MNPSQPIDDSRRSFLNSSAATGAVGSLLAGHAFAPQLFAAGSDLLRVGLVGCGGRGTGAANQALQADPRTELVAMGDAFPEEIEKSLRALGKVKEIADRVKVDDAHKFSGLDAYRYVIDSCDVVLLAAPPGFRPEHLEYAVEKEKHIFTEKPMATDVPGVRSVIESVKRSKEKNLAVLAGFCWRYSAPKRAFFEQILDGAVGDVLCVYTTYLTGPVKPHPDQSTRPEGISDLEWMVRNWYNYTWLAGDGLVEQACHSVDWIGWAKGDSSPESCTALGGRQVPSKGGDIYDHVEVNYLWEDGTRGFFAQRQISGCYNDYSCYILGSKGQGKMTARGAWITGQNEWTYKGPNPNMYQVEHDEFFKSIRDGQRVNDGDRMVNSTMMAIMGRMAGYSGQQVTWEEAMKSDEKLVPETPNWDTPVEFRPIPTPGITPLG